MIDRKLYICDKYTCILIPCHILTQYIKYNPALTGGDLFICQLPSLDLEYNYIFNINAKSIETNGQSLLHKTFIYDFQYNKSDLDERRCLPIRYRCRNLCINYKQIKSKQDQEKLFYESLTTLIRIIDKRLTKNQKRILKKIQTTKQTTMTSLSDIFSKELDISKTTVRNSLQIFREIGLIYCGNAENKGQLVSFTPIGEIILDELKNNKKEWR